jgi:ATP-dependent Lon protease
MSENLEKVSGIKHLPIFPLPLVLLPNELLPLHIFEPRYQQMLRDISLDTSIFGVTFFQPNQSFVEKPEIESIGCAAEVRESQTLPDGRSNILTIGLARYRLIDWVDAGEPYFVGDVEFFEDFEEDSAQIQPVADEVFSLFERIASAAHKLSGERGAFPEIPQAEPEALSFLITAAFNLETSIKYELLETRSTYRRLTQLYEILKEAVVKMEDSAEINKIARTNGHSKKKLDF